LPIFVHYLGLVFLLLCTTIQYCRRCCTQVTLL